MYLVKQTLIAILYFVHFISSCWGNTIQYLLIYCEKLSIKIVKVNTITKLLH